MDFQNGHPGNHLGFPIRTISISHPMLPTKFQINWLLVQENKRNKDFQDGHQGGHLGLPISIVLAIFDLQVMLPTKFGVSWPFSSGEEAKN